MSAVTVLQDTTWVRPGRRGERAAVRAVPALVQGSGGEDPVTFHGRAGARYIVTFFPVTYACFWVAPGGSHMANLVMATDR